MVETLALVLIVGLAALHVGRRAWRTLAPARPGAGAGCGCASKAGCSAVAGVLERARAARRPAPSDRAAG